MLLSHIALPLLSLAASALAKPSSDFSLKKRQNNAEAFVVETLKLQTEKIATIQGAFETATQGWSEDDPAPHPGYVAEITNEYHFVRFLFAFQALSTALITTSVPLLQQIFASLQYTSEAVGNRSTELKAATLDVDNRKLLLLLFVGPPPSLPLTALLARTKSLSCLLVKLMLSQATFILSTFTPTHQTSGTPMETAAQLPIALITLLQPESS